VQIRQKTAAGLVVGVGNRIPRERAFTRDLTDLRHD
jgi:hypothetical protein